MNFLIKSHFCLDYFELCFYRIVNDRVLSNILGKACLSPLGRGIMQLPQPGFAEELCPGGCTVVPMVQYGELTDSKAEPVEPSMKGLKERMELGEHSLRLRDSLTRDHL